MSTYFSRYPDFIQNPNAPIEIEFQRLAGTRGWSVHGKRYRKERAACFAAEFEYHYASQEGKLAGWQSLCTEVDIAPCESITQCRKALKRVWVNIVDLVNRRRQGRGGIRLFPSQSALRAYCLNTGKIFPLGAAKRDGFLKALLIELGSRTY